MKQIDVKEIGDELKTTYPGCHLKISDDNRELVAEIPDGFAVAVIERSQPHFHMQMREVYRGLRGTLHVACAGRGHVLRPGYTISIEPGQIHFAVAANEPAWIEVVSDPPWSKDDHFVL